jgi:hypothetical protein
VQGSIPKISAGYFSPMDFSKTLVEASKSPEALRAALEERGIDVSRGVKPADYQRFVEGKLELTDWDKVKLWGDFVGWARGNTFYDLPLYSDAEISIADWIEDRVPVSRRKLVARWIEKLKASDPMADRRD